MATDQFGIVGTVVGGAYRVDEVVAEGGFAVVYRAHHAGFRASIAIKCLKMPRGIQREDALEFLEQFRAEAELLYRLSAIIPTVVRPLHVDAFTAPDGSFVPFMALEWLEGENLDQLVKRRELGGEPRLSIEELHRLLTPVARARERAHNFVGADGPIAVVHRDLKPENIFIAHAAGEELVKILDFGIGKAMSVASQVAGRASQHHSKVVSFTPAYGAPEQWLPKRYGQTGPWTDVWGLALTMVEALAARPILDGDQAAMMGTALDEKRRPTPRNEGVQVSDAVEAVFQRAMSLDPRERQPHAGVLWDQIEAALGLAPAVRAPSGSSAGIPAFRPASVPDLEVAPPPSRSSAARELEIDSTSAPLALELDDAPPRPVRRMTPPAMPAVAAPGPVAPVAAPEPPAVVEPAPKPAAPPPPRRFSLPSPERISQLIRAEDAPVSRKLIAPGVLLALGVVVTVADNVYAASTGEIFAVGPLRAAWLAVPLVIGGIALLAYRFVRREPT
jgi:serine/threonine-protein kinase